MSEFTVARLNAIYSKFIKRAAYVAFVELEMSIVGVISNL